jgi:uroporphyrinogen-III synthase
MADDRIPSIVADLIADRLDSIPELEAVLLLRENRAREWTAEDAGRRLYVSTTVAAHLLGELQARGFFARTGEVYRYAPESEALAASVDELAVAYARHLVAVTQLVHAKPRRDVRDFANAFRLRKPR